MLCIIENAPYHLAVDTLNFSYHSEEVAEDRHHILEGIPIYYG